MHGPIIYDVDHGTITSTPAAAFVENAAIYTIDRARHHFMLVNQCALPDAALVSCSLPLHVNASRQLGPSADLHSTEPVSSAPARAKR